MKKLLFGLLALTFIVATSCSKEAKINRRLDGEWKTVSYDGQPLAAGESETWSFNKDKKDNGTGTLTVADADFSFALPFTYVLNEDKITFTITFLGEADVETLTVTKYERKSMEFTESDGTKTVLEPK